MVNLKTINEAVKQNITLESARDNLKLLQEQEQKEKQYKDTIKNMGVIIL